MKRETTKAWMTASQGLAGIAMTCLIIVLLTGFAVYLRDTTGLDNLNEWIYTILLAVAIYVYIKARTTYRYSFFDDELIVEKFFGKKRRELLVITVDQMLQIDPLANFGPSLFELKSIHRMFTHRRNASCLVFENDKNIREVWFNPSQEMVDQIAIAIKREKLNKADAGSPNKDRGS